MTQDLMGALTQAVLKGIELAEKSGKFMISQAPDLVKEFYQWNAAEDIFWIIFSLLMIYLIYKALTFFSEKKDKHDNQIKFFGKYYHENDLSIRIEVVLILNVISVLIFGTTIVINLLDLIYLYTAPKLYLIEGIKHFLK